MVSNLYQEEWENFKASPSTSTISTSTTETSTIEKKTPKEQREKFNEILTSQGNHTSRSFQ